MQWRLQIARDVAGAKIEITRVPLSSVAHFLMHIFEFIILA